jgi:hypothetical protein
MQLKKALLASAIAALSSSALAMEAMDEDALASTTGQDGLTITITPPGTGITANIVWHDNNGYGAGAQTNPGALVIGDPLGGAPAGTHEKFSIQTPVGGGIVLDVDVSGDVDAGTIGSQPGLRILVGLPMGATIVTGDISVATSAGPTGSYALTNQTTDILNSMTIGVGSGTVATVNLGSEAVGTAMIQLNATLTGGIAISNFALTDANSGGAFRAVTVDIEDNGASTNLVTGINVDALATGVRFSVASLGSATGMDVTLVDVGLGSATSMGDIQILGLNLTGTQILVVGH